MPEAREILFRSFNNMKKELSIIAAFAIVMLTAIGSVAYYFRSEVVSSKMVEVELLKVSSSSKCFYVDIRDLSTKKVHKGVRVSKHGNGPNDFPYGFPFLATRVETRYVNVDGEIKTHWDELDTGMDWSKQFKIQKPWPFKH